MKGEAEILVNRNTKHLCSSYSFDGFSSVNHAQKFEAHSLVLQAAFEFEFKVLTFSLGLYHTYLSWGIQLFLGL